MKLDLKRRVTAKFGEGGVSGAVSELASADDLSPQDEDTPMALIEKHPSDPEGISLPNSPDGSVVPAVATVEKDRKGIMCFHDVASCGPDGLRPGHNQSLTTHSSAKAKSSLLSALTDLIGQRHAERWSSTVCCSHTLWRKWMCHKEKRWFHPANCLIRPVQLGVSTSGGCDRGWRGFGPRRVFLKTNMRNAFNSLKRD